MSPALEKLLAHERIKKPASRWHNWWLSPFDGCGTDHGDGREHILSAGDVVCGSRAFPSKEIAEEKAALLINSGTLMEYLGAFPEGQRP